MQETRRYRNRGRARWPLVVPLALALVGCQAGDDEPAWPAGQPPVAVGNQLMGTLVLGTVEAGGGYLVGAAPDRLDGEDRDRRFARQAVEKARENPVTAEAVQAAPTADLNYDGFITTDELIALSRADLPEGELLRRLEGSGYVFELSPVQQDYLLAHGVNRRIVAELPQLNPAVKRRLFLERLRGR